MIRKIVEFCVKERLVVFLLLSALVAFGWHSIQKVPLDAIPNVGENQVIVLTEWPGRSPKDIENQITYPLSVALQSVAGAESVRGKSMFGFSFVQVTFADNVDFYWARSRVSEQLTTVTNLLPEDARPQLAPDATPLGQIYYYVLDPPPGMDLAEVRSKQDYVVKYALQSVDGVAEVASIGGHVRQYQIEVNPDKLRFHKVPLETVLGAVRDSNMDVGAKTVEAGGMEYLVRGIGFIGANKNLEETIEQIEQTVVTTRESIPVRIKDVASVQVGPAFRRGALDWNGSEAAGGVVVMRYGENPREVIQRVKEKIKQLEKELNGIRIHGIYDRTLLVNETAATLTQALTQQILITVVVVVLFLLHFRSSIAIAVTLPLAVLMAFIAMNTFGIDANIMSLAGIAIAIGTMVDMAIIVSENIYRHLADWEKAGRPGGQSGRIQTICDAACEVAPAVVTAVSTTVLSFLPVFYLTGRDYRLFSPLAWTKTFSLVASLIVAISIVPMLSRIFLRSSRMKWLTSGAIAVSFATCVGLLVHFVWGSQLANLLSLPLVTATFLASLLGFLLAFWLSREKIQSIESNPLSRVINSIYRLTLRLLLRFKRTFLVVPSLIVLLGAGAWLGMPQVLQPLEQFAKKLGTDFNLSREYVDFKHRFQGLETTDWIALDEGSWFYMPSLYPAASFAQALEVLQTQDTLICQIPEVKHALGKIGRVESALDPAPTAMIETYVMLKPKSEWREGMTEQKIWEEINDLATLPGVTLADELQPIQGRVVMLQSGIKAAMAIRIYGSTLDGLSAAATAVADHLKLHPMVKSGSVSPDIVLGKPYFEFEVNRSASARYGMNVRQVNQLIETALGGKTVTRTVEGRERYSIQVRYRRDLRENIDTLHRLPVVTHTGDVVPLADLATMKTSFGPGVINSEDARLVAHVSFAPENNMGVLQTVKSVMRSLGESRKQAETGNLENGLVFPEGDSFEFEPVGSFQNQIEANNRLKIIIPVVLLINLFLIYLQFREIPLTLAIFTGIPVAFGGAMLALAYSGVELNTAVWVGFIALFGIAIDDGVIIATYLSQRMKKQKLTGVEDIRNATLTAGLMRIRPCLMTTATTVIALLPVLYATGRGADVARSMALPVFGGMLVELITLFVLPVVYCGYMEFKWNSGLPDKRFDRRLNQPDAEPRVVD
ncbi:MAG: efflux RND transporter permease subunit [Planctomycetota bacterium]|nr:efflux RND transporter permease subunit [Planctomycetota bacterium]